MFTALVAPELFDGNEIHGPKAVLMESGRIIGLVNPNEVPSHFQSTVCDTGMLAPGLIDLQVNGGGGVLLNNQPDTRALQQMASGHASVGVSRILPTVISDTPEVARKVIDAVVPMVSDPHSGVLGVHLEGPFFSTAKSGVHRLDALRQIANDDWSWLRAASAVPAIVTLAPECVTQDDIRKLVDLGLRLSAGHTDADYETVCSAINAGLNGFTHLFNAMSAHNGRAPGVVGAALTRNETWCGLIADGIHVHPASIQLALSAKPVGKVYLVSDAMATVGTQDKRFELYGEPIEEVNGRLQNSQGRLAGSAISLVDAVQYVYRAQDVSLTESIAMASRYPAEYLRVADQFGSIRPGYWADFSWWGSDASLKGAWRAGQPLELFANGGPSL
ncbi:N-acetylglucosamine-6-phosphate deacetylase [Saccharospirillum sp.]|uniref:N-acetylglucosamine-6-phosphate deacetylase n=1 Tax=Saccharospirillum sp. TaxID=2033801 RepID=UPI0034A09CE3